MIGEMNNDYMEGLVWRGLPGIPLLSGRVVVDQEVAVVRKAALFQAG